MKQSEIVHFLEWMNKTAQESPMQLETDNEDIALMYLSETQQEQGKYDGSNTTEIYNFSLLNDLKSKLKDLQRKLNISNRVVEGRGHEIDRLKKIIEEIQPLPDVGKTISAQDILDTYCDIGLLPNDEYVTVYYPKLIDAIEAYSQQSEQKWVSVEDRLPEIPPDAPSYMQNIKVIACWGKEENDTAEMDYCQRSIRGNIVNRFEWHGKISPWKITHWQPLPTPPQTDKK